jgi:hypothetical protein
MRLRELMGVDDWSYGAEDLFDPGAMEVAA